MIKAATDCDTGIQSRPILKPLSLCLSIKIENMDIGNSPFLSILQQVPYSRCILIEHGLIHRHQSRRLAHGLGKDVV